MLTGAASMCSAPLGIRAPPAAAMQAEELQAILERTKTDSLTTDNVFTRAVRNDLIDPKAIIDCKDLAKIAFVDKQAAEEIRVANYELDTLYKAYTDVRAYRKAKAIKESLELGKLAQTRIETRAQMFDDKYNTECILSNY